MLVGALCSCRCTAPLKPPAPSDEEPVLSDKEPALRHSRLATSESCCACANVVHEHDKGVM